MTVEGIQYNFHVPTKILARNLIIGVQNVTSYSMVEQTHTGTSVEFREMTKAEMEDIFLVR